jgi:hypothetical protein
MLARVFEKKINGHEYTKGYYLADNIYLRWSTFMNNQYSSRSCEISLCFAAGELQKDIEGAFGVLQARFAIIMYHAVMGFKSRCEMCACVIIHNKIIESGRIHPL